MRLARGDVHVLIDAGAQIEPGRASRGVVRQRELSADALVEDLELDLAFVCVVWRHGIFPR